jgi:hypothetical protein
MVPMSLSPQPSVSQIGKKAAVGQARSRISEKMRKESPAGFPAVEARNEQKKPRGD